MVPRTTPTFLRASKVVHNTIEGDEDSIDVYTADTHYFIATEDAEIVHKDYRVRSEGPRYRWHPAKERT